MPRPARALLLVALLLSAGTFAMMGPAGAAGETGVREVRTIDSASAGAQKRFEAFDTANLNLYDVDGDGKPEIITNNDNNRLYVIDPRRGKVLSEIKTYYPSGDGGDSWGARVISGVAVGDLDKNGLTDLVVTNSAAQLSRFEFVRSESTPDYFHFREHWHIHGDARKFDPDTCSKQKWIPNCTTSWPGMDGNPAIGDVDGDGILEVFVNTDDFPGHFSFTADGQLRWMTAWWDGNAGPTVTDVDGDGTLEAIFVTDGGSVAVYNAKTGKVRWSFDARKNGAFPGSISVSATAADYRGTGEKLIVVGTRNVSRNYCCDPQWPQKSHAIFYAFTPKGELKWKQSFEWGNPHLYMHPAPVDVNGDGVLDFIVMDWNTVGHKPGNWETTGRDTNVIALNGTDGTPIWRTSSKVGWSNKDLVVADVTGDGKPEVVHIDGNGFALRDLRTGTHTGYVGTGWEPSRGPVAADLYGDGRTFLVVPVMRHTSGCTRSLDVGCREGALKIFETSGRIANAPWTNNVLFNAHLDPHPKGTAGPEPVIEKPGNKTDSNVTIGNDTIPEDVDHGGTDARGGEPTETRVLPAPGLVAGVAFVAGAAALLRRRRLL
ncbi:MAG TPA: VCBS repeat-containing protein [Candidatus Thermoplasmatota archaeon]|nr:VCBS repeat-containing protein [Candidatus Thermoplasmatota archaeon]